MNSNKEEVNTENEKTLKEFYFSGNWQSLFSISYLFFFIFFGIFFIDNVFLAIRFLFKTLFTSTTLLSLNHAFWGGVFIVSLVMPFIISLVMIFSLPKIWENKKWKKDQKILITVIAVILAIFLMTVANDLILTVGEKGVLDVFLNGEEKILTI